MLLWWFHSHTIHVPRWQREPKRYFGNKWAFSTGTVSNAGTMVEQHRETHGHDWTCSSDFCNRVDCQRFEREKKKKRYKTHTRLKERFLIRRNRTERAFFFFFSRKASFQATYNNTTENSWTNLSFARTIHGMWKHQNLFCRFYETLLSTVLEIYYRK